MPIVQHLIEYGGANVDVQNQHGYTPLMNAASKGFQDIVAYLLNNVGANPLIKNQYGENAYDVAAANQQSRVCEMLELAEREWWERMDNQSK
jgi:ankyrin repeat protein